MSAAIRIVIYDDNKNRRESLAALIGTRTNMQVVGLFENCSSIVFQFNELKPDVILMDIDMPEINGIEGVRLVRMQNDDVRIIMQTVFEDDEKIFSALQAGANGYILKKSDPSKLVDAINDVMEGGAPLTPQIAQTVINYFSNKPNSKQEDFNLTERESEILTSLSQGRSYKLIAEEMFISVYTVNNHIKKIYKKLQVNSATEAIAKYKK